MKRAVWLLLGFGLLACVGCRDKDEQPFGSEPLVFNLSIYLVADTVWFLPGDSAYATGWVAATNYFDEPVPGVKISIPPPEPFGGIELLNSELRDITNDSGRVYFRFRSFNQTGTTTIHAAVGTHYSADWPLTVLVAGTHPPRFTLTLSSHQLHVPPQSEDSLLVSVVLRDSSDAGIEGVTLPIHASGGRLNQIPPTNAAGRASTWWYSNGEYGLFHIWVEYDTLRSEDSVLVLSQ
jgi:hypothetical protein